MADARQIIHTVADDNSGHVNNSYQRVQETNNASQTAGNYERSRAHMVSGDGNRNSNNRRPSMAVVNSDVHNNATRSVEFRRHSQGNIDHRHGQDPNDPRRYSQSYHDGRHGQGQGYPHGVPQTGTQALHYHSNYSPRAEEFRGRRSNNVSENVRYARSARSSRSGNSHGTDFEENKDDRYVVPALPMPLAILCCVLNFLLPGFGSITASVCVFCCARTEDMTFKEKCGSCCTVFGIGVLQLLLVACFLIGWIWSCIWGVTFIGMSASYYDIEDDDDIGPDSSHARASRARGMTPLPTPQIVEDQPYPGIRYDDIREHERRRRQRREAHRRTRSRISITPSNLIYPMRAPSNIAYNSPPPSYEASLRSQQAPHWRGGRRSESERDTGYHEDQRTRQNSRHHDHSRSRPPNYSEAIPEEDVRR